MPEQGRDQNQPSQKTTASWARNGVLGIPDGFDPSIGMTFPQTKIAGQLGSIRAIPRCFSPSGASGSTRVFGFSLETKGRQADGILRFYGFRNSRSLPEERPL